MVSGRIRAGPLALDRAASLQEDLFVGSELHPGVLTSVHGPLTSQETERFEG